MKKTLIIILSLFIISCSSMSKELQIKNIEKENNYIILNKIERKKLETYEINILKSEGLGYFCLSDENFKKVGNNDNKKDLYIYELEKRIDYYEKLIKKN